MYWDHEEFKSQLEEGANLLNPPFPPRSVMDVIWGFAYVGAFGWFAIPVACLSSMKFQAPSTEEHSDK